MINLPSILSFAAALLLTALAVVHLLRGTRRPQKTFFVLSAFLLAAAEGTLGFILRAPGPQEALQSFHVLLAVVIFSPAAGLPFFMIFGKHNDREIVSKRLPSMIILSVLLIVAVIVVPVQIVVREIHFTEDGVFWGMTFSGFGKAIGVYLIIINVLFLYLFENTYRSSSIAGKVTLKYPLLGLLTVSVIHFIVISRVLAISMLDRNFLAVHSCGIILLCASFLYATVRYRLFDVQAYIGRGVVSSVVTIIVSGLYLISLALISYVATALGMPYDRLTFYLLGLFAVFLLLAVLISGKARRRLRQFINENFYFNRYNYRKEWRDFARLMSSIASIDEFCASTISFICEAMLVQRGLLWVDVRNGKTAAYGMEPENPPPRLVQGMYRHLDRGPVTIFKRTPSELSGHGHAHGFEQESAERFDWIRAVAFLRLGDECRGMILLGPKDMGNPYTDEDGEFLATIADQAALAVETLLLEEKMLESRQMESFNRFASFVIHDLKNTVGMLSLTAENANGNIHDVEFQKDVIKTINRSVEKMKGLIHSLNAFKEPTAISKVHTDIVALARKSVESIRRTAESHVVDITFEETGPVTAPVDAQAISRILENVLLNAIEATPEGGSVTASAGSGEAGRVMIAVTDTGKGFSEAYLSELLFRPFHSTKKGGLGIGLVLSKSLVEAHGGSITIESEPSRGSTVRIQLPDS